MSVWTWRQNLHRYLLHALGHKRLFEPLKQARHGCNGRHFDVGLEIGRPHDNTFIRVLAEFPGLVFTRDQKNGAEVSISASLRTRQSPARSMAPQLFYPTILRQKDAAGAPLGHFGRNL